MKVFSDNIINKPCFSDEDRKNYDSWKNKVGDRILKSVHMYMEGETSMQEALDKIHNLDFDDVSEYTVDLFFVLECTYILGEKYKKEGIDEVIFEFMVRDIKSKLEKVTEEDVEKARKEFFEKFYYQM